MNQVALKDIFKKVRRLEVRTKGLVNSIFGGEYHSAFKGRGMTFSEVREYQYGDDVRTIDWNVSARRGDTYIKVFEEEREQTLVILYDASASGGFGSGSEFKKDLSVQVCATLAFSAIKNNDKVGLIIFTSGIEKYISPRKGRSHVLRILRELFFFEAKEKKTNIKDACEFASRVLKKRSIVFLVSDLIDSGYEEKFRLLRQKHDFVVIHIIDHQEDNIPKKIGYVEFQDLESDNRVVINTFDQKALDLYKKNRQNSLEEKRVELKKRSIDSVVVKTNESFIEPLTIFFRRRNKR